MSRIDQHPQKQRIIDALLAGRPLREIAKWVEPTVSIMSLQRYKAGQITPAMRHADTYTRILSKNPDKTEVQSGTDAVRNALRHAPVLAAREKRLEHLQDRHNRLQMIVEERATDMADAPGGKSGLLTRDYKGKNADQVVYRVDTGLLSEFREHEKHMAIELGQWQESVGQTNVAIQIVVPSACAPASGAPAGGGAAADQTIDIALPTRR